MSKKSGYSYVSESSIDRNLLCGLCGKPFEDPRSLACNDVFCYACIHRRNEAGHLSCPSCRKFLQNTSVNQINRPLQNMLNDLRVKCLDCGQDDLKRGEFDKHLSSKCRKSNTVCSYTQDGDSLSGTREEVLEHSAQGGCPSQLKSEMLDVDERDLATGIESDAVLSDGGLNSDDGALSAAGDKKDDGSMMAAKNKAKDKAKSGKDQKSYEDVILHQSCFLKISNNSGLSLVRL